MFLISIKQIVVLLLIVSIFSVFRGAVSAQNNDTVIVDSMDDNYALDELSNDADLYVSNEGDDDKGNGSFESPFNSINHAVNVANNNSKIILKDGVYKGNSNTNIIIDKSLTIESISGATIDGGNTNFFFRVNFFDLCLDFRHQATFLCVKFNQICKFFAQPKKLSQTRRRGKFNMLSIYKR